MTASWSIFTGSAQEWDRFIYLQDDYDPRHSYAWGEVHRSSSQTEIVRLVARKSDGAIASALQCIRQKKFGLIIYLLSEGGFVGDPDFLESLTGDLTSMLNSKRWYLRFFATQPRHPRLVTALKLSGFKNCISRIHTGLTMTLPLASEVEVLSNASSNWRHNLKRGKKKELKASIWNSPSPDEMKSIYQELEQTKDIGEQFSHEALGNILNVLNSSLILVKVADANDHVLSLRGAYIFGNVGLDLFSATTKEGRSCYASHVATEYLLQQIGSQYTSVKTYDLAGIDPLKGRGVYNFKKGTGAIHQEYLGEWDLSPFRWISYLANFVLATKLKRRQ